MTELSPSDLRHRLTLEELQCDEDEGGGFTESWVTVAELWADLRPSGGSEGVEVDRLAGRVTHDVSLCYRPGVRPSMRFRQGRAVVPHFERGRCRGAQALAYMPLRGA